MQQSIFYSGDNKPAGDIFTIGHSNKPISLLIALLIMHDIEVLVDCRSRPYSRYNPQFNRENMRRELEKAGIKYEWRGNNMGGLDSNVHEEEAYEEYSERAKAGERIALCCSEGKPERCHRSWTLAPEFVKRGLCVYHILWSGDKKVHV